VDIKEQSIASDPAVIKFKAVINDETYEEIIEYNTILDQID